MTEKFVVYVDDEEDLADIFHSIVEEEVAAHGFKLEVFSSPTEAKDFIEQNPVQLLMVDFRMPEMSGIELIQSLSRAPARSLLITGEILEKSATDLPVLMKPIDFDDFFAELPGYLGVS